MTSCPHLSACLSRRYCFAHLLLRMHLHVTLHCRDFLLTFRCPSVFLAIAPPPRSPTFSRSSTFSPSNRTLSHHHPSLITYFCLPPCRLPRFLLLLFSGSTLCSTAACSPSRPTAAQAVARSHNQRPTLRQMSFVCLCASNRTSASPNGRTNVCLFGSLLRLAWSCLRIAAACRPTMSVSTFRSVHAVTCPLPLCYVLSFVRSRAHPNSPSPGRYCSERIPIHRLYSLLSAIPISSAFVFFQRFIVSSGSRVLPGLY